MPVGIAGEGGQVLAIRAEAGDRVASGQVLAEIDASVSRAQLQQLQQGLLQARADSRLAQAELDRAQTLVARGFISKSDIDKRMATRDSANARVALAGAQVRESSARLGRLSVRAPAAGIVLQRNVEAGQVVSPGSGALFRVAKDGALELRAQVAEQDLAGLKVGMAADVVPVGSATSYRGRIWLIDPVIDPQTRQGVARIALAYAPGLRVGGFASASIVGAESNRPVLPQAAVLADERGSFVMVVGPDNRVQRRAVTIGSVDDRGVGIASGLSGNERIVASAGAFVRGGEKVVPVRATAAALAAEGVR
jgi:HlyD family secretion protein